MVPGIPGYQGLAGVATARGDYLGWSQESQDTVGIEVYCPNKWWKMHYPLAILSGPICF